MSFHLRLETGVGEQCVVDPDVADIEGEGTADTGAFKRRQHQANDFAVGLNSVTTEQLSAQLNRCPSADHRLGGTLQRRPGVAKPRHALLGHTMRIHSGCLRRDVGSDTEHSAAHLIGELAGHHIEISAQADEQRVGKFDQRRDDIAVAPRGTLVQQAASEGFQLARAFGQQLVNTLWQKPAIFSAHRVFPSGCSAAESAHTENNTGGIGGRAGAQGAPNYLRSTQSPESGLRRYWKNWLSGCRSMTSPPALKVSRYACKLRVKE